MEEKDFKKLLAEYTEEIKRHGKVLLEESQDQLNVVAEVQIDNGKKLDDHSRILESHSQVLNDHSQILNDHSRKLDAILEMVASNSENIELIKSMLRRKVDIEEFEALTKRVMVLENKLLPFK